MVDWSLHYGGNAWLARMNTIQCVGRTDRQWQSLSSIVAIKYIINIYELQEKLKWNVILKLNLKWNFLAPEYILRFSE